MAVLLHPPCCPATCRLPLHSPPARPPTCIRCIPMLQRRDSGWVTQRRRHRPRAALATRGAPQAELGHRFSVLHQACRRLHRDGTGSGGQSHAQCRAWNHKRALCSTCWGAFRKRHLASGRPLPPSQAAPTLRLPRSPALPAPACTCSRSISGCSPGVWASSEVALSGSSGSRQLLPSLPSMASANGLASGTVGVVGRRADTCKSWNRAGAVCSMR